MYQLIIFCPLNRKRSPDAWTMGSWDTLRSDDEPFPSSSSPTPAPPQWSEICNTASFLFSCHTQCICSKFVNNIWKVFTIQSSSGSHVTAHYETQCDFDGPSHTFFREWCKAIASLKRTLKGHSSLKGQRMTHSE